MSPTQLDYAVAATLWCAIIIYGLFAGADFGGGVWDLLARGPRRDAQRRSVSRAMGPVWEANHVWLIFMLTGLFTAFPGVFATLAVQLYIPFSLVLVGIVFRGAAFAFRAHASEGSGGASAWGTAFGVASALTPAVLGACAGAVAGGGNLSRSWTTPFALTCGALALAICAGLAAAYLAVEEAALGDTPLMEDFRLRALWAGAAAGVLALAALGLAGGAAPRLLAGLTGRALPLTGAALLAAGVAAGAMWTRRLRLARGAAAGQVAAILVGWAVAQDPYLVPPSLSVTNAAAEPRVMATLLLAYGAGMLLLLPSLYLLFHVFKGRNPSAV